MEILNIKELSEYLKISTSTIRRMIFKKEIPYFLLSNQYFFNKENINNWINNQIDYNFKERKYDEK